MHCQFIYFAFFTNVFHVTLSTNARIHLEWNLVNYVLGKGKNSF